MNNGRQAVNDGEAFEDRLDSTGPAQFVGHDDSVVLGPVLTCSRFLTWQFRTTEWRVGEIRLLSERPFHGCNPICTGPSDRTPRDYADCAALQRPEPPSSPGS